MLETNNWHCQGNTSLLKTERKADFGIYLTSLQFKGHCHALYKIFALNTAHNSSSAVTKVKIVWDFHFSLVSLSIGCPPSISVHFN